MIFMATNGTQLGNTFNVVQTADGVYIDMDNYEYVTFIGYKTGGDTYTITEGTAAGGGTTTSLPKIEEVYTSDGVGGVWTKVTQVASAAHVTTASCVAITVRADMLTDGKKFVACTSTSTGTVTAILTGLKVQRNPANLSSVIV